MFKLKEYFEKRSKQKAIANIRMQMIFFGHDVSDMTDEEIEEGVIKFGELISKSGVTAQEAANSFRQLSPALVSVK